MDLVFRTLLTVLSYTAQFILIFIKSLKHVGLSLILNLFSHLSF
jgi:hypothetical protein